MVEWTGIDRERIEHWEAGFSVDFTLQELYLLLWTVSRKFEPVLKPVERTVDCHRCRVPLEPRKTSRMVMGIAVDNLPGTICPHCGEEWRPDVELIAILEEPIDIARIPEGSKLEFVCWKKGMGRGHGIRSTVNGHLKIGRCGQENPAVGLEILNLRQPSSRVGWRLISS